MEIGLIELDSNTVLVDPDTILLVPNPNCTTTSTLPYRLFNLTLLLISSIKWYSLFPGIESFLSCSMEALPT